MISRVRGRPRLRSCSFRTLWWLVKVEAEWRVVYPYVSIRPTSQLRAAYLDVPSSTRSYRAERCLFYLPERRWFS